MLLNIWILEQGYNLLFGVSTSFYFPRSRGNHRSGYFFDLGKCLALLHYRRDYSPCSLWKLLATWYIFSTAYYSNGSQFSAQNVSFYVNLIVSEIESPDIYLSVTCLVTSLVYAFSPSYWEIYIFFFLFKDLFLD